MNGKIMSEETEKVIKVNPEETEKSINTNQESATFLVIGDKAYTSEIIEEYNRNAEAKTEDFNTNAENKTASYNSNAADRTTAFNNNYDDKVDAFNSNANSQTEEFDSHVLMQTNTFNKNAASTIANYNSNAEQKTTEFNQNALSYQEGIDANKKHIINVSNELERVKNDILETGTDTDTFVHLEDSAMAEYQELIVDGVCEQVTTTGKQMINNSTYKLGWLNKGSIDGQNSYHTTEKYMEVKPNTDYTLSQSENSNTIIAEYDENKNYIKSAYQELKTKNTITTSSTTKYVRISVKATIFDAMLNEGSEAIPYEPYTGGQPSPSPDYPQEIKTIENSLKITSCNKNLFDKNTMIVSGDKSGSYIKIPVSPNTTYSILINKGYENNFYWTELNEYDENDNITQTIKSNSNQIYNGTFNGTFTTTENANYIYGLVPISLSELSSDTYNSFILLENGSTKTDFEQHLETQIEANLPEGEFIAKINDTYKDTLKVEYNEEDVQYHLNLYKKIGKVVLNGSEAYWDLFFSTNGIFINTTLITNINSFSTINCLSNYYANTYSRAYIRSYPDRVDNACATTGREIIIANKSITSVDDFKTWLSTHNTEVYYVLAKPYVLDLGVVDMPLTYNETTNLFTDSDLLPTINAKYYRNFISTIQNLQVNEKALKQELIDINTRLSALESAQTSVTSESEVTE